MKRVLVIFLVFAITSLANAVPVTPVWTISSEAMSPEYAITVSVVDSPQVSILLALVVDSNGILSNFAAGPNAPEHTYSYGTLTENYGGWDLSHLGQGEIWDMLDYTAPAEYVDGDWLSAEFVFAPESDSSVVSLYQIDGEGNETFLTSHTVIPEPMTIALLGVGSLFLCRRR
jgi:hypothetical protein